MAVALSGASHRATVVADAHKQLAGRYQDTIQMTPRSNAAPQPDPRSACLWHYRYRVLMEAIHDAFDILAVEPLKVTLNEPLDQQSAAASFPMRMRLSGDSGVAPHPLA